MTAVSGALRFLDARGNVIMLSGLAVGLAVPPAAAFFRPMLEPAIALLLVSSLVRMRWGAIGAYAARPLAPIVLSLALVVAGPAAVWAVGVLLGLPGDLARVLFLAACAGPIVAAPVFAQMLRLDAPLAVAAVVLTTFMMPVTLPALADGLAGLALDIPPAAFLWRVAFFILAPFALAGAVKLLVRPDRLDAAAPEIGGLTVVLLIFFGMAVMDGAQARLLADPAVVSSFVLAAFLLNLGLQAVAGASMLPFGRDIALTAALSSGNRNVGLVLGLLGAAAGPDFLLFVAAAQLPIFVTPLLAPVLYRRFRPA